MASGRRSRRTRWISLWEKSQQHKMLRLGMLILTPLAALVVSLLIFALVVMALMTVAWFFVGCPVLWAQDTSEVDAPPTICIIQETTQLNTQGTKITSSLVLPNKLNLQLATSEDKNPTSDSKHLNSDPGSKPGTSFRFLISVIGKARCQSSPHGPPIAQVLWTHLKLKSSKFAYAFKRPFVVSLALENCTLQQGTKLKLNDSDAIVQTALIQAITIVSASIASYPITEAIYFAANKVKSIAIHSLLSNLPPPTIEEKKEITELLDTLLDSQ